MICFLVGCSALFSTEPAVTELYYIHYDEAVIYLEMHITEVEQLLGKPHEIKKIRTVDPLHTYDKVSWLYDGLQVSFIDFGPADVPREIGQIAITNPNRSIKLGQNTLPEITTKTIKCLYGDPEKLDWRARMWKEEGILFCRYTVYPLTKIPPRTFDLYFRFDAKGACDEVIFQSDMFW